MLVSIAKTIHSHTAHTHGSTQPNPHTHTHTHTILLRSPGLTTVLSLLVFALPNEYAGADLTMRGEPKGFEKADEKGLACV